MVSHDDVGPAWAVSDRSRGLCERSCAALKASVGGLELLLRLIWAVLGCSQGLSGRSWAALGASLGGPGPLLALKWPFLEREGDPREVGLKSGLSRAERHSQGGRAPPKAPKPAERWSPST